MVNVDPVSGNEIPPGGTAEGVRDDVDAKLSEGEYVIPANVVRFYGIDKFEKMIVKAQETLMDMESSGRMGGKPTAEPAQEELPFADEELPVEMSEGGVVGSTSFSGFESKVYVNDEGQRKIVMLYNGMPINGQIPAGFYPEGKGELQGVTEEVAPTLPEDSAAEDQRNAEIQEKSTTQKPIEEWTVEDFEQLAEQQDTVSALSKSMILAGPGGMLIGAAIHKGNQHALEKANEEMLKRIQDPNTPQDDKNALTTLYNSSKTGGGKKKGEGILGGIIGKDGLIGDIFGTKKSSDTAAAPAKPTSFAIPPIVTQSSLPTKDSNRDASNARPSNTTPMSNPSTGRTRHTAPNPGNINRSSVDYRAPEEDYDRTRSGGAGPFNKGGFVTRRKK